MQASGNPLMGCQHTTKLHSTIQSCNKRFRVYAKTMDTTGLITARQKQPATSSACLALPELRCWILQSVSSCRLFRYLVRVIQCLNKENIYISTPTAPRSLQFQ